MDANTLVDQIRQLSERERRVMAMLLRRGAIARDINKEFQEQLTLGQRVADRVASFGGSWPFIFVFLTTMAAWMFMNTGAEPFDPYPFILLNLVLSCLAALQAPVIMMSQNRQAARDRLDARHDYEVNLRAEMEITDLHAKLDRLRDTQWQELVQLQQTQIQLLEQILRQGTPPPEVPASSRQED